MFEKILICLDGSEIAEKIIPAMVGEALKFGSEVIFFRVVSLPETIIPVGVPGAPVIPAITTGNINRTAREQQEAWEYLEALAQPLIETGMKIENVVLPGNAGETIIRYAEDNNCTLIAMASHGHGGFRRFTLGSTTEFVMHRAQKPVLIIR